MLSFRTIRRGVGASDAVIANDSQSLQPWTNRANLCRLAQGRDSPTIELLARPANAMEVDPVELFTPRASMGDD